MKIIHARIAAVSCLFLMVAAAVTRPDMQYERVDFRISISGACVLAAILGAGLIWGGRIGRGCLDAFAWSMVFQSTFAFLSSLSPHPGIQALHLGLVAGFSWAIVCFLVFLLYRLPPKIPPTSPELTWAVIRESSYFGYFVGLVIAAFTSQNFLPLTGPGPSAGMEVGMIWFFHLCVAGVVLVVWSIHVLADKAHENRSIKEPNSND